MADIVITLGDAFLLDTPQMVSICILPQHGDLISRRLKNKYKAALKAFLDHP